MTSFILFSLNKKNQVDSRQFKAQVFGVEEFSTLA